MSILKKSLFVGCVLLALVALSQAACRLDRVKLGSSFCIDKTDKTWHRVGSNWINSRCEKCTCDILSMKCCDGFPMHVPTGCVITYYFRTCRYTLTSNDPNVKCYATEK